ncbi:putative RNA-directed DNA polymerase [Lupinus albus]|uniref:Putative RNA-directed DNA polymerase n=1 Tax=Lupinus albus TaxID=3870 RepID=A0A6A4PBP7_LUPAL|nr:putative RNA-directed DNA polymerase [Lupinus albus]
MPLGQMVVYTFFLHGELDEKNFMTQPKAYNAAGKSQLVCKLKKSLYRLK